LAVADGVAICRGNGGNGGGTTDAGALGLGLARFAIDLIPHRVAKIAERRELDQSFGVVIGEDE